MNSQQFKAWFEGFTEQMSGSPNELQWKRIKEKVTALQPGYYYPVGYPYWNNYSVLGQPGYNTAMAAIPQSNTFAHASNITAAAQQALGVGYSNTVGSNPVVDYFQEGKTDYNG